MKFSGDGSFEFRFVGLNTCAFLQGRLKGQSVQAVGHHSLAHVLKMMHQPVSAWAASRNETSL